MLEGTCIENKLFFCFGKNVKGYVLHQYSIHKFEHFSFVKVWQKIPIQIFASKSNVNVESPYRLIWNVVAWHVQLAGLYPSTIMIFCECDNSPYCDHTFGKAWPRGEWSHQWSCPWMWSHYTNSPSKTLHWGMNKARWKPWREIFEVPDLVEWMHYSQGALCLTAGCPSTWSVVSESNI